MVRILPRLPRALYACTLVLVLSTALLAVPLAHAAKLTPIVFVSDKGGQWDIWVMQGDGSNPVQLTNDKAEDDFPEWSPDGKRIVWTKGGRLTEGELWVMNADGSGKQQLTFNAVSDFGATWSPDGSQIAWRSRRENNADIYAMNLDGTNLRRLTTDPASDLTPDWSPDGTRIAFISSRSGHSAIYTMNPDGSDVQKLTADELEAGPPGWSPDGNRIVFVDGFCATCAESDLFYMNADGTGLTQLTDTPENEFAKAWTLDGKSVVGETATISGHHLSKGDLVLIEVATGAMSKLTDTPGSEEVHADCSQSGRPTSELAVGDTEVSAFAGSGREPSTFWSSARPAVGGGSAHIDYAIPGAGHVRLWVFDVAGREVAQLVDGWQPAGRHVAMFVTRAPKQLYLYRVEWQGRRESGKLLLAP